MNTASILLLTIIILAIIAFAYIYNAMIMLHESGIYVFESKNYDGWIFGSETQKNWTQSLASGRGKTRKYTFLNPIIQNKVHVKWLQSYLHDNSNLPVYSYIVFSERCEL